ncbi:PREDICTED: uncharacterized protein LOC108558876 [Nicrophorus vespilloides]|uniref:Uncharacterized protein LOC108558876 n=1 Tax=Nicrophorus vespilloides TaxID=110193 RepID=A0ABM1MA00_NICVS|nr:PREDICTED: uncharacterized protein LOC108558876 [Nicrophorus vespilloides]
MNYLAITLLIGAASHGLGLDIDENSIKIDLSNSKLTEIQDFKDYAFLEEIDLSNNDVTEIQSTVFKDNLQLKRIDLSGNKKLEFPKLGSFLESVAQELNLSNCDLRKIPGNAFDDLLNLQQLDLSENPIDFEDSDAFGTMGHFPQTVIVSKITEAGLKNVCRVPKMTIVILDESKNITCSQYVQRDVLENVDESNNLMDDGVIEDNHLDIMMSDAGNDESLEGSGDAQDVDSTPIIANDDVEKYMEDVEEDVKDEDTSIPVQLAQGEELEVDSKEVNKDDETRMDEVLQVTEDAIRETTLDNANESMGGDLEEEEEDSADTAIDPIIPTAFGTRGNFGSETEVVEENEKSKEVDVSDGGAVKVQEGDLQSSNTHAEIVTAVRATNSRNEDIKTDASTTPSSSSNIAVTLVIAVIVVGSVAVSYKCWQKHKKPRYDAVNGATTKEDPNEGKELKEIKVEAEKKPLMPDVQPDEVEELCDCTAKEVINEPEKHTIPPMDDDDDEQPKK